MSSAETLDCAQDTDVGLGLDHSLGSFTLTLAFTGTGENSGGGGGWGMCNIYIPKMGKGLEETQNFICSSATSLIMKFMIHSHSNLVFRFGGDHMILLHLPSMKAVLIGLEMTPNTRLADTKSAHYLRHPLILHI